MTGVGEAATDNVATHPAKFSLSILSAIREELDRVGFHGAILDPFAGVGRVHNFYNERRMTIGVELEPEWAEMHARTITGSCLELEALGFVSASFDAIITSPVYGNRMSDHHDARDGSKRNTYKHALGRDLSDGSSAVLQWGPSKAARERYKDFHREAWRGVLDVLKPDGLFVLNISDHIRGGERMRVSAWHKAVLATYGVDWYREDRIETPRNGQGQNGELRVEYESIFYGHKR